MSPASSAYVARRGDRYSLRVDERDVEHRLDPIDDGLRGLLQVEVTDVFDDGSVREVAHYFRRSGLMPPGAGWSGDRVGPDPDDWRWTRVRRHPVWNVTEAEAEALLAVLGRQNEAAERSWREWLVRESEANDRRLLREEKERREQAARKRRQMSPGT